MTGSRGQFAIDLPGPRTSSAGLAMSGFAAGRAVGNVRLRPGEALERLAVLQANGDTGRAFGRAYCKEPQAWKTHGCNRMAAE